MYGVDPTKPGAAEYYQSLLNLYASWGVDFIKVDDILSPVYHKGEIEMIRKAIDKCGRKIVLSLSPGDALMGYARHVDDHANMYRMANDVWDRWEDILHIFDVANDWSSFIGNGTWPDADMIPIGKLCLTGYPYAHNNPNSDKREHFSFLTFDEQKTFMTLWCIARSPLMWGGSALYSSDSAFAVLSNKDILHIQKSSFNSHQVYMTNNGQRAFNKNYRIWVAEDMEGKIKYVALFNLEDTTADVKFNTQWELWKGNFKATELWTKEKKLITDNLLIGENIAAHGVKVFKLESDE
jgi:alpha-galactosidase